MPAKKKSSSSRGRGKVKKVMREYKRGELKSGRSRKQVKNPKQAIAIALNEARESGAKIPRKRASAKRSSSKRASRSSSTKRSSAGRKSASARKSTRKRRAA